MKRTVCTAPLGQNILNIDDSLILDAIEIDNNHNLVLFDVKLQTRTARTSYITVPTFGITDACGTIKVFGMATRRVLAGALARIGRQHVQLANKVLRSK